MSDSGPIDASYVVRDGLPGALRISTGEPDEPQGETAMTNTSPQDASAPKRSRKKLIAAITAAVVLAGAAATAAGVSAYSAETNRLCEVALADVAESRKAANGAATLADEALAAAEVTSLPDGGTTATYVERKGAEAVPASDGKDAVEARPSGEELVGEVRTSKVKLVKAARSLPEVCDSRGDADAAQSAAAEAADAADAVTVSVNALEEDFALFQKDEVARLAAEKAAADAAAEAARVAEEAAAAGATGYTDPATGGWVELSSPQSTWSGSSTGGAAANSTSTGSGWTPSPSTPSSPSTPTPAPTPSTPTYTIADCPPGTTQWGVTNGQLWCKTYSENTTDW